MKTEIKKANECFQKYYFQLDTFTLKHYYRTKLNMISHNSIENLLLIPLNPPPVLTLARPLMTTSSTLYVGAGADGSYTGLAKLNVVPAGGGLFCIFRTPYWASVVSICNKIVNNLSMIQEIFHA